MTSTNAEDRLIKISNLAISYIKDYKEAIKNLDKAEYDRDTDESEYYRAERDCIARYIVEEIIKELK